MWQAVRRRRMDVARTPLAQRIARALAGLDHSANAQGVEQSASSSVDDTWRGYLEQADAILRTIREPSEAMAAAGDPRIWSTMIEIAIKEQEGS
jgi:precorrin-2 methylase